MMKSHRRRAVHCAAITLGSLVAGILAVSCSSSSVNPVGWEGVSVPSSYFATIAPNQSKFGADSLGSKVRIDLFKAKDTIQAYIVFTDIPDSVIAYGPNVGTNTSRFSTASAVYDAMTFSEGKLQDLNHAYAKLIVNKDSIDFSVETPTLPGTTLHFVAARQ